MEDKLFKAEVHYVGNMKDVFPPHLSTVELLNGIKEGRLHQGTFRASRENFLEGFVNVESYSDPVSIKTKFQSKL